MWRHPLRWPRVRRVYLRMMGRARYAALAAGCLTAAAVASTNFTTIEAEAPADTSFDGFSRRFRDYHTSSSNVVGHLITMPLGFFAVASLLNAATGSTAITLYLATMYVATLMDHLPLELLLASAVLLGLVLSAARATKLSLSSSAALLFSAYAAQEFLQLSSSEAHFSNAGSGWLALFLEHCYYLLPLCVDALAPIGGVQSTFFAYHTAPEWALYCRDQAYWLLPLALFVGGNYLIDSDAGVAPGAAEKKRMLYCNMGSAEEREDLASIRAWALSHAPPKETSSHWWYTDLDEGNRAAFDRLTGSSTILDTFHSKFGRKDYGVDVVSGMNEIYVTGPPVQGSSDTVFYTEHIDGPWGLFPFCSLYRCIVGMDDNDAVTTHFPVSDFALPAKTGDVLAFDFNREIHYITRDPAGRMESDGYRVVLKFHYVAYPKCLRLLGRLLALLNTGYNMLFRALFLATITPKSGGVGSKVGAFFVVHVTELVNAAWLYVGPHNALFVGAAAVAAHRLQSYALFLGATSFVHHVRYMSTAFSRKDVNYGNFKRDVLFFKTIAAAQLLGLWVLTAEPWSKPDAAALLLLLGGAAAAAAALGRKGVDKAFEMKEGPKGAPGPMALGQVVAMLGMYKSAAFRAAFPWLVPAHVAFYTAHMLQEAFDVRRVEAA